MGVEILPIVFHHRAHITKLNIDTPSIQLIQNASGEWNFSSIGANSAQPGATGQSNSVNDLTVEELRITDGSATVSSIPLTNKPFQYTEVNLAVKNFSFLKSAPFDLSAKLPGEGSLKLSGNAGPISRKDTTQTPFQAKLQLREFDPVASGIIDKTKGITMQNDVDAQISSDGTNVTSTGKIKASQLQLVPRGSPAHDPIDIDYTISHNMKSNKCTVSDIAVHTGSVEVHANGSFEFTPQAVMLDLRVSAPNLPIDQLEQLMPVVGIYLPNGSSLQGGTMTANISVSGPATAAILAGPVEIDNTELAGFDLGSKIEGLTSLTGTSGGTADPGAEGKRELVAAECTNKGYLRQPAPVRLRDRCGHNCRHRRDQLHPDGKAELAEPEHSANHHGDREESINQSEYRGNIEVAPDSRSRLAGSAGLSHAAHSRQRFGMSLRQHLLQNILDCIDCILHGIGHVRIRGIDEALDRLQRVANLVVHPADGFELAQNFELAPAGRKLPPVGESKR